MSSSDEVKTPLTDDSILKSVARKDNMKPVDESSNSDLDIKKSKFDELMTWLKKWGFIVSDKSKESKASGIEFKAEIHPQLPYSSGLCTPFYLEFQDDLEDGLIIRTTFELDKNIEIFLKSQNMAREIELTYIEIARLILPLRISFIREHPFIKLYKVIFISNLDKQLFLDCVTDLMNSMSIIIGKWDEKYYQVRPLVGKADTAKQPKKTEDPELDKILNK